jgi:diguanylate cyclase (GGDEF)-like protein
MQSLATWWRRVLRGNTPRERQRLDVLSDVARRLAALPEKTNVLEFLVNSATTLLNVEAAGLRLLDGNDLVLKARTSSAAAIMSRVRLAAGESLSGHVLATGQPVAVDDLDVDTRHDAQHKRAALELGFHGYLGVPLRTHDRIIGVLSVFTQQRRKFEDDEIALLATFADLASLAIETDRILQDARGQAIRLRALARLNQAVSSSLDTGHVLTVIAEAAAELTGAPSVSFWVADEVTRQLHLRAMSPDHAVADFPTHTLGFDDGIAGWVAAHGRSLEVPDVFQDPRTFAVKWFRKHNLSSAYATPIVFHGALLGVVVLFAPAPFQLTAEDREVLDAFGTQAGVAIRNARLFDTVRLSQDRLALRSRELDLLNRMGGLLQACAAEDEAYAVFARFIGELFPSTSGAVFAIAASRNMMERRTTWGAPSDGGIVFQPDDCWALRSGRLYVVESAASGLFCNHLPDPPPATYVCVPLIAQGESLGILYLGSQTAVPWPESLQRLAATVADQLGLAVANLQLRQMLQNQSIHDPLTGLFNRRYFEVTLERELKRAERHGAGVGIVIIDLDHFKQLNDTFGHDAGDMVLREVARLLQSSIRVSDVACRYGGEEFILVFIDADVTVAQERAERVRAAASQLFLSHHGQSIGTVRLSAGVAVFPVHGKSGEALVQAADAALYQAKRAGRDRVHVAE